MNNKIFIITLLLTFSATATCQTGTELNQTDQQDRKQGYWMKKYPNGSMLYEGMFKDDHPVSEFKRYYEDNSLRSVLIYSDDGNMADATIYHYNGLIASKGRYVNQMKEGKWKFYSASSDGYLICEEEYSKNLRNGESFKYYPDGTIAERLSFINDKREGEWLKYHPNGKLLLKSCFSDDLRNGKFDVWYEDGILEISGFYKDNLREGAWFFYNPDGTIRYKINYVAGYTDDNQMDIDATNLINDLEKNSINVADPEKTGEIR